MNRTSRSAEDKLARIPVSSRCALAECPEGSECEICQLAGTPEERLRLLNLGFQRNSRVRIVQIRNNHYIVCVDGSRFALSRSLADAIHVQPSQDAAG